MPIERDGNKIGGGAKGTVGGPAKPQDVKTKSLTADQLEKKIAEFLVTFMQTMRKDKIYLTMKKLCYHGESALTPEEWLCLKAVEKYRGANPSNIYDVEAYMGEKLDEAIENSAKTGDLAAKKLRQRKGKYIVVYEVRLGTDIKEKRIGSMAKLKNVDEPRVVSIKDYIVDAFMFTEHKDIELITRKTVREIQTSMVVKKENPLGEKRGKGKSGKTARANASLAAAKKGGAFRPAAGKSPLEVNVGESGAKAMSETSAPVMTAADPFRSAKSEIVALALEAKKDKKIKNLKKSAERTAAIAEFLKSRIGEKYVDVGIGLIATSINEFYFRITKESQPPGFLHTLNRILSLGINVPESIPRDTKIEFGGEKGKPGEVKVEIRIPGK